MYNPVKGVKELRAYAVRGDIENTVQTATALKMHADYYALDTRELHEKRSKRYAEAIDYFVRAQIDLAEAMAKMPAYERSLFLQLGNRSDVRYMSSVRAEANAARRIVDNGHFSDKEISMLRNYINSLERQATMRAMRGLVRGHFAEIPNQQDGTAVIYRDALTNALNRYEAPAQYKDAVLRHFDSLARPKVTQ